MKIAICGSNPVNKMNAPFGDPEWKIWACSPHNFSQGRLPRVDEWFENHVPAHDGPRYVTFHDWEKRYKEAEPDCRLLYTSDKQVLVEMSPTRPMDYLEWVRDEVSKEIPVWVRDTEFFKPDKPVDVLHRDGGVVRLYYDDGWGIREYPEADLKAKFSPFHFTSSIALMLAKAVNAEPEAIGLWGIMQASQNEWTYQRPGIQYFLNEAHKRGITVIVPEESRLLDIHEVNW